MALYRCCYQSHKVQQVFMYASRGQTQQPSFPGALLQLDGRFL